MAYFQDLALCDYFGPIDGRLLAVGWLDCDHAFTHGRVASSVFEAFARLAMSPWQPIAFAGTYPCPFCVFTGGPCEVRGREGNVLVGATNVFVPSEDAVYVAPSLTLHYMDAHEYLPPEAFQRAVEACPPMRSMDYLKLLQRHRVTQLRPKHGGSNR